MGRDRRILVVTALLAVGAPLGAYAFVHARTTALAEHLGAAGGVPVTIGRVDADLTGSVRLSDVAFGSLVSADAIEASVSLDSLLSGELHADEIQIESPRVAIEVDADGDSNLARFARRLAKRPASTPTRASTPRTAASSSRVRRIVVSEGTLTARIAGVGEISADGVELVPDAGGVRVITGPIRVSSRGGPLPALASTQVELAFTRSAAELSMPQMKVGRVLAVGGGGKVVVGDRSVVLRDVTAGRLARPAASAAVAPIELHASLDDDTGIARTFSVELTPSTAVLRGDRIPLGALAAIAPRSIHLEHAHATGTLRLVRDRQTVSIEADGSIEGVALEHKTLAEMPIPVAAAVRTTASINSEGVTLSRFELDTGAIHARASGAVRRASQGSAGSAQIDFSIDSAPCADLLSSLPIEVRGPLDGLVLEGTLGLASRLTIDLAAPVGDGAALTAELIGRCKALAEPPAADVMTLVKPPVDEPWFAIKDIPARVQGAFVSAEDGRFWSHDGFDLQQIARSLEIDLRERRLARGGSTISQQLIKNAFLTHRRTLDRKIQEAVLTWRLEARLEKAQILERYLNVIELGPNIHGIGAAAQHWFGTTPRYLSTRQAAFLGAITSEPGSMSRRVRRHGSLDPVSAERVATILRAMRRDGVISSAEYDAARATGMGFTAAAIRDDR